MAGLFEVVFEGSWYGQQVVTRRFYQAVAESVDHQDVADVMGSYWVPNHQDIASFALVMDRIRFRNLTTPGPGIPYVPVDWPYAGLVETDGEPPFVAVDVVLLGGEARYPYRGRARLAGVSESQKIGGLLTAGAVADWQLFANFFATVIVTSGSGIWTPVLHSEVYSPDNVVAAAVVQAAVTTQNSRKFGRGS